MGYDFESFFLGFVGMAKPINNNINLG